MIPALLLFFCLLPEVAPREEGMKRSKKKAQLHWEVVRLCLSKDRKERFPSLLCSALLLFRFLA